MSTIRAKTHIPYTITIAVLSIPMWAALWIAIKVNGDIGTWRPWLLLSHWNTLAAKDWETALWGGFTLALMTGAGLAYMMGGMVLGVTATDAHGDARWATAKEIRAARLVSNWGLVLGKLGKPEKKAEHLRAHTDDQGTVLVSGPPRSGKGVGIIVPTLLDYPGSMFVYDVKGELFETTARRRLEKGDKPLCFFSPTPVTTCLRHPGTGHSDWPVNASGHWELRNTKVTRRKPRFGGSGFQSGRSV